MTELERVIRGLRMWRYIVDVPLVWCKLKLVCRALNDGPIYSFDDMVNWSDQQPDNYWGYATMMGAISWDNLPLYIRFANERSSLGPLLDVIRYGALEILKWRSVNARVWTTGVYNAIEYGFDAIVYWYFEHPRQDRIIYPTTLKGIKLTGYNAVTIARASKRLAISAPDFRRFTCAGRCSAETFIAINAITPVFATKLHAHEIALIIHKYDLMAALMHSNSVDERTILTALRRCGTSDSPTFGLVSKNTISQ